MFLLQLDYHAKSFVPHEKFIHWGFIKNLLKNIRFSCYKDHRPISISALITVCDAVVTVAVDFFV